MHFQRGDVAPRYHATTRPPLRRGGRDAWGAGVCPRSRTRPSTSCTCRPGRPRPEVRRRKAAGVDVSAEMCPHYLVFTESVYAEPDPRLRVYVIAPPLRLAADRDALWAGLADGSSTSLRPTTSPTGSITWRKPRPAGTSGSTRSATAPPGIETPSLSDKPGLATGRLTIELHGRSPGDDASPPLRPLRMSDPSRSARTPTSWLFDPAARRTMRAADLHHTSDYTPYEGLDISGSVRRFRPRSAGRPRWRRRTARLRRLHGSGRLPEPAALDGRRTFASGGTWPWSPVGRTDDPAWTPRTSQPSVKLDQGGDVQLTLESSPPPAAIARSVAAPRRTALSREKTAVKDVVRTANSSEPRKNASNPK